MLVPPPRSAGGTRWTMYDHRGGLRAFDHTGRALRYCRWGDEGVTLADDTLEAEAQGVNTSALLSCDAKRVFLEECVTHICNQQKIILVS